MKGGTIPVKKDSQRRTIKQSERYGLIRAALVVLPALFIVWAAVYFTGKEPVITMAMSDHSETNNKGAVLHDSDVSGNTETATFALG